MEFVSRRGAAFSACTKIEGVLEVHFTFSRIMEFVKCAKKPRARFQVEKFGLKGGFEGVIYVFQNNGICIASWRGFFGKCKNRG